MKKALAKTKKTLEKETEEDNDFAYTGILWITEITDTSDSENKIIPPPLPPYNYLLINTITMVQSL